ncbi:MAG: FtsX-like permease family protein [Gemmatimonadaceae bacterium]
MRTPVLVLFGAAGMVLLIACANLANLLLAGTTDRRREIAVRCSLGASPRRIVRQLLLESFLLALGGAVAGLAIGAAALRAAAPFLLERMPHIERIGLDPAMLLFTSGMALATALLFGVVPAITSARIELAPSLKDGVRGTRDRANRRLNDAFVVAQVALSLTLLVGAGLLLRSFSNLMNVDRGFRAENVLIGRVSLPWTTYDTLPEILAYADRVEGRLRGMPGLTAVGLSSTAPFSANNNQQEVIVQGKEPRANEPVPVVSVRRVSEGYFAAIGTPLLSGRPFTTADRQGSELVVIIDESLATRYWPGGNPIGARIAVGSRNNPRWRTVVGVAASIRHQQLDRAPDHYVYGPLSQNPTLTLDIIVRSPLGKTELTNAMQLVTRDIDATAPVYDIALLSDAVAESLATRRMTNTLMASFTAAAVLLAAIGIFGVLSRNVAARVKEFGVRLALGASPRAVVALVVRRGLVLVLLGIVFGVAGAFALTGFLRTLLFGVAPRDLATYIAAPVLFALVALVACWLPARRATTADPLDALRGE